MTMHAYVDYDEDSGTYEGVRLKTVDGDHEWKSAQPIRDWYLMMKFAKTQEDILIYTSSLTHFLSDVPGYRTVERHDGEYIVWDASEGKPSPRDVDWTNGIVNGWDTDKVGSDGWANSWYRGTRHAWRCADSRKGMYWQTADLIDGRYQNHHPVPTQEQAFSRN